MCIRDRRGPNGCHSRGTLGYLRGRIFRLSFVHPHKPNLMALPSFGPRPHSVPQADEMKKAANWGGLFHFKPNVRCLLLADFVAKVGGPLQVRNFRIQWARRLNQSCAAGLFFESMLRVETQKIFLQQYRHLADNPTAPAFVRYWTNNGQRSTLAGDG